jgi:hypothetical protein
MTSTDTSVSQPRPRAAAAPRSTARASYLAVIVALALLGVAAVALRDAAVAAGWLTGSPWVTSAVTAADGWTPQAWVQPVGVVVMLLGMAAVVIAVAPRRVDAQSVGAEDGVYIGLGDIAKLASAAAEDTPGVLRATSTATRRTVTVRCTVTDDGQTHASIAAAVDTALQPLAHRPRVVVRTRKEGRS